MPGQRKSGKRMVGFYASEDETLALFKAAQAEKMTVADFLRKAIRDAHKAHKAKERAAANRVK